MQSIYTHQFPPLSFVYNFYLPLLNSAAQKTVLRKKNIGGAFAPFAAPFSLQIPAIILTCDRRGRKRVSNACWKAADGVARLLCTAPHVIYLAKSRVPLVARVWEEHAP